MSAKSEQANEIIRNHTVWAMGAGAVPLPIIDVAAVTMIQLDMLKQLCRVYGQDYNESSGKNLITAIAGSTLARLGASFVKAIPVVGSLLGGVSMAVLSGASTYGVGQVFINHFEGGGSIFNIDLNWSRQQYEKEYKKGEEFASNIQKQEKSKPDSKGEIFNKLDELVKLKKDGILTEDEFNRKKEELLKRLYEEGKQS
jgi:uncharacterized protein (DUF697 family)